MTAHATSLHLNHRCPILSLFPAYFPYILAFLLSCVVLQPHFALSAYHSPRSINNCGRNLRASIHISYHYHLADTISMYSHWLFPYFLWYHRLRIVYINLVILFLRSCTFKLYHPHTYISCIFHSHSLFLAFSRCSLLFSLLFTILSRKIVSRIQFAAAPVVELPGICAARRPRDTRIYHLADTTQYHQADTLYLFFTLIPYLSLTSFCLPVVFIPGSCVLAFLRGT